MEKKTQRKSLFTTTMAADLGYSRKWREAARSRRARAKIPLPPCLRTAQQLSARVWRVPCRVTCWPRCLPGAVCTRLRANDGWNVITRTGVPLFATDCNVFTRVFIKLFHPSPLHFSLKDQPVRSWPAPCLE